MAVRFSDKELLFGAAIARLVMTGKPLTIHEEPAVKNQLFTFTTEKTASTVLFKYSTKRRSPWQFTVTKRQGVLLRETRKALNGTHDVYVALVCYLDGTCLLSYDDLVDVGFDERGQDQFWCSVARPNHGRYRVSGPDKMMLPRAIPGNRWSTTVVGMEVDDA